MSLILPDSGQQLASEINFKDFSPALNKVYLFDQHCLMIIDEGIGLFEVDFRVYQFSAEKAIFLSPGQYFQLLSGSFKIRLYEFSYDKISNTINSRFLFKHLVSLGYIDLSAPKLYHLDQLRYIDLAGQSPEILTFVINRWITQNPFQASEHEINLLFDLKDIVDERYRQPIRVPDISKELQEKPYRIKKLTKEKLQSTVNKLHQKKILLEAQRQVVFTDLTTKEIAYDLGFNDPTYFNRFFKSFTNRTPGEFRCAYQYEDRDPLINQLTLLINEHFKGGYSVGFYADQLNMSAKTLSKKVKERADTTVYALIKARLVEEAKAMLRQDIPVNEIAFELGFKEPNHFSAFFKANTSMQPTEYRMNY